MVMDVKNADKSEDFITALVELQKACGVDDLRMSDYGFKKEETMTLAKGTRSMQGFLYTAIIPVK